VAGWIVAGILLVVVAVPLVLGGQVGAEAAHRLYVPLAANDASPTPTVTPFPTATATAAGAPVPAPAPVGSRTATEVVIRFPTETPTPRPPTVTRTPTPTRTASPTSSASATPTHTASPTPATCVTGLAVSVTALDKAGEIVTVSGSGELSGWYLVSEAGGQRYTFPTGFRLEGSVQVRSGVAYFDDTATMLWWRSSSVWNNSSDDDAFLYDCAGTLVTQFDDGV
jgi:hypothetical protein